MKSNEIFQVRERVRWSDVDSAGIIYFGAYARLSDVAESEFLRSLGFTYATFRELGFLLPRVHIEFDFFKPALLDDLLTMRTRVKGVGVHSVRLGVEFFRESDSALLAEATLVASCVDLSGKSIPLNDSFAQALRANLSPD
jgi:acyl-CoA thioester hydrolase